MRVTILCICVIIYSLGCSNKDQDEKASYSNSSSKLINENVNIEDAKAITKQSLPTEINALSSYLKSLQNGKILKINEIPRIFDGEYIIFEEELIYRHCIKNFTEDQCYTKVKEIMKDQHLINSKFLGLFKDFLTPNLQIVNYEIDSINFPGNSKIVYINNNELTFILNHNSKVLDVYKRDLSFLEEIGFDKVPLK